MKSFIINLDRNPERLAVIGSRFAALGMGFDRIRAVDARALSSDEIDAFRRRCPTMPWVHAGQIGCFLSHLAAWRSIAAGAAPYAAVFEDDVHVSDDLALFLDDDAPPVAADILRLETSTNRVRLAGVSGRTDRDAAWHGRAIRRVMSTTWCTGGYVLSREAALRLVALPEAAHQPVDWMLFCFERSPVARSLAIAQLVPAVCVQDRFLHADPRRVTFASEIEAGLPAETIAARLSFYARNIVPAVWKTLAGYERVTFDDGAGVSGGAAVRTVLRAALPRLGDAVVDR